MIAAPELLTADHDLSRFDCGKPVLNDWLRTYALVNQAKGFTRVMVLRSHQEVIGYYGLAPTAVPPPHLPRKIRTGRPPDPIPCLLIGQLAIDLRCRGLGYGSALLRHALERCVLASDVIGGRAVMVRAIDSDAEAYWRSCGFEPSQQDRSVLYRALADIRAWLETASKA